MDEVGKITLIDRLKDIIKTGGETVPSIEVETVFAVTLAGCVNVQLLELMTIGGERLLCL